MELDSLKNTGFICLNEKGDAPDEKTLVVVGVARGGTSIVAGALRTLGVFMGDRCAMPVFEDVRLSRAFEGASRESFKEVIEDYDRRHAVWGWKRPSTLSNLDRVSGALRNPHFVFVFRDPLLIANRNAISMGQDPVTGLRKALKDLERIVDFLGDLKAPAMLLSSERAVEKKDLLLAEICRFAGIRPSESQLREALDFISPDPVDYLDATRNTKSLGKIESGDARDGKLRGWARAVHHDRPVSVEVFVNGELAGSVLADLPGGGEDGETRACRFEIDPGGIGAVPGSEIRARVRGDIRDLKNSPFVYSGEAAGSDLPDDG